MANNATDEKLEEIRRRKAAQLQRASLERAVEPPKPTFPSQIVHVTSARQYAELMETYPSMLFVVDFSAQWCAPCKMFAPIFEKLQRVYQDDAIFLHVDIDQVPDIASYYRVTGVPTTIFTTQSKELARKVGLMPEAMLQAFIKRLLAQTRAA